MLCPVFWLFKGQEQVYSHHRLLHHEADICDLFCCFISFHVYPITLHIFLNLPSSSCVCIFLLQSLPLHPMQVSFQATSPLEIFTFTRKTSFSPCLYSTLVTHATVLSRHSEAGLVFPLKQISNSSGSCCHLEICYVPGTVLNTHPQ